MNGIFAGLVVASLAISGMVALGAEEPERTWTIYIAQDKHLDYNWCGTTTEIELRMATLVDFYLSHAEQRPICGVLRNFRYRCHPARTEMGYYQDRSISARQARVDVLEFP